MTDDRFALVEPHADARQGAHHLFQFYAALVQEGFTTEEALCLISVMVGHR